MPALHLHRRDDADDESMTIARAADGEPAARQALVAEWTPVIHRFALRMLRNDQDAHDAAQDTMVKVLRYLDRYDPNRSFKTWVFGIARNTCIDLYRKRKRRAWDEPGEVVDHASPSPIELVSAERRAERVHEALEQVPPLYREVLVMYHFEHMKYVDIAEALDVPLGTVMNRIFRARRKLRDVYTGQDALTLEDA